MLTIAAALLLAGCASGSGGTTPAAPTPTSVPPAIAFADTSDAARAAAGLWTEVESNPDLASCLANASASSASSTEDLRDHVLALGQDGQAIIADCLNGA